MRKPSWLGKKINLRELKELNNLFKDLNLNTVCLEASCPNISECFSKKTATFLILGNICTRSCKFCGIEKGDPKGFIDENEPSNVAKAVKELNLKHVVITSVTRDDLEDGGAAVFVQTINVIRKTNDVIIEALIPDFKLDNNAIEKIVKTRPEVIGHNLETVPRLYQETRQGADYVRSLEVLKLIKELDKGIYAKTGLMLGLGEKENEVIEVLKDLRNVNCDFLSLGQYLSPTKNHLPVKEYIEPEKFDYYKKTALELGFSYVASGPYVRSSYMAHKYISDQLPNSND